MGKYTTEEVNQAKVVIKDTQAWVKNAIKEYRNDNNFCEKFECGIIDYAIRNTENGYRGKGIISIKLSHCYGYETITKYADGYWSTNRVTTEPYMYSAVTQTTDDIVDFACLVAKHWSMIKREVELYITRYNEDKKETLDNLNNFTI